MKLFRNQSAGYVALISVTLVMLTVVIVGITITLLGANSLVSSLFSSQGQVSYYRADSCAYDTLLQLKRSGLVYVGTHTITFGDDSCTITVTNTSGTLVDVDIVSQHADTYRELELTVDTADLSVALWQEVTE